MAEQLAPPSGALDTSKTYTARFKTQKGDFAVELYADRAPRIVENFVNLARAGFYDGTTFDRVIDEFMAEGGDPTGRAPGAPATSPVTSSTSLRHDAPACCRWPMRRRHEWQPFFLTYGPTPHLDTMHSVFGRVPDGRPEIASRTRPAARSQARRPDRDDRDHRDLTSGRRLVQEAEGDHWVGRERHPGVAGAAHELVVGLGDREDDLVATPGAVELNVHGAMMCGLATLACRDQTCVIAQALRCCRDGSDGNDRCVRAHAASIARALADPKRLCVLEQLADGERSVSDLSREVGCQVPNMSQHLSVLRAAGLVAKRREGTTVFYRLVDDRVLDAYRLLQQVAG